MRRRLFGKLPEEKYWDDDLKSGCIHLWDFNDQLVDKVGTWHLGAYQGSSVSYEAGKMKKAYRNWGEVVLTNANLSDLSAYSISFWTKVGSAMNTINTIMCDLSASTQRGIIMNSSGYLLYYPINGGVTTSSSTLPFLGWIHVVINSKGMYFNNKLDKSHVGVAKFGLSSTIDFGAKLYYGVVSNAYYGSIEQFAIWDRDLSVVEIAKLWNEGKGLKYD